MLKNGKVIGVVCIIVVFYFLGSGGRSVDTENVRCRAIQGFTLCKIDLATYGMDYWRWDMNIWLRFEKSRSQNHKLKLVLLNAGGSDWKTWISDNAAPPMDCVVDGEDWRLSENGHHLTKDPGFSGEKFLEISIGVDFLNALSSSTDASCTIGPTVIPVTREMVRSVDIFLNKIEPLI